jgi:hypothetical protein
MVAPGNLTFEATVIAERGYDGLRLELNGTRIFPERSHQFKVHSPPTTPCLRVCVSLTDRGCGGCDAAFHLRTADRTPHHPLGLLQGQFGQQRRGQGVHQDDTNHRHRLCRRPLYAETTHTRSHNPSLTITSFLCVGHACRAGTYTSSNGSVECKPCDIGFAPSTPPRTKCEACPAETFAFPYEPECRSKEGMRVIAALSLSLPQH